MRDTNLRVKDKNIDYVLAYFKDHPCSECGEDDPLVLEFDHLDRKDKTTNVARLLASYVMSRLVAEIAKCRVLCANCHRRHTATQMGYRKLYKV